jgi:hypothetical protein
MGACFQRPVDDLGGRRIENHQKADREEERY